LLATALKEGSSVANEESIITDEYLGDTELEDVFRCLTNYNPHFNSMPAILSQFKGLRCMVTAEFECDRNDGPPEHVTDHRKMPEHMHFLRLVIEPDFDETLDKL
jgi:hypothetical protein